MTLALVPPFLVSSCTNNGNGNGWSAIRNLTTFAGQLLGWLNEGHGGGVGNDEFGDVQLIIDKFKDQPLNQKQDALEISIQNMGIARCGTHQKK